MSKQADGVALMLMSAQSVITVSAVCLFNAEGLMLTVRKRGTHKFMNPGGKPEPGETPAETASRELLEEIGVNVTPGDLELLGAWEVAAANEADTLLKATVFVAPGTYTATAAAEIEELRWLDIHGAWPQDLSPLLLEEILPALLKRA